MNISVRQEKATDVDAIADVVKRAYQDVPYSNHREHLMVERLRSSMSYLPELSLVAEVASEIVGHVLLTKVEIRDQTKSVASLALAPLSVVPEFQKQGVGGTLIKDAHQRARSLGFSSIVLIGIPDYYARFGYMPLSSYPIKISFNVRAQNCMIASLSPNGLANVSGTVVYPPEWMEQ